MTMNKKDLEIVKKVREEVTAFRKKMREQISPDVSVKKKIALTTYVSQMTEIIIGFTSVVKDNAERGITPHEELTSDKLLAEWKDVQRRVEQFFVATSLKVTEK